MRSFEPIVSAVFSPSGIEQAKKGMAFRPEEGSLKAVFFVQPAEWLCFVGYVLLSKDETKRKIMFCLSGGSLVLEKPKPVRRVFAEPVLHHRYLACLPLVFLFG